MIFKMWRAYQRHMDLTILWKELKAQAPTMDIAKAAFMTHAANDTAWTKDFTEAELIAFVDALD